MPASIASCAIAKAVKGVSSEGFNTTVHPAASAGATLRVIIEKGKFHGVIAPGSAFVFHSVLFNSNQGTCLSVTVTLHD
jgi:hypothetical protein